MSEFTLGYCDVHVSAVHLPSDHPFIWADTRKTSVALDFRFSTFGVSTHLPTRLLLDSHTVGMASLDTPGKMDIHVHRKAKEIWHLITDDTFF